ncbi:hypothetical protein BDZ89DRAFT_942555 [Hymenopellis radicata]|nr:hypothetical protein BDZ89DRAFT_942555 [Hymenopellis radicata]
MQVLVTVPKDGEVEVLLSEFGYKQKIGACVCSWKQTHLCNTASGAVVLSAPVSYCPNCPSRRLQHDKNQRVEAQLFTQGRGMLPVYTISKYCRFCKTSYHPTYWVQDAQNLQSQRVYYSGIPDYIQASETHWVERSLAEEWTLQMAVQHASGVGIAEVYNMQLREQRWHGMTDLKWRLDEEIVSATFRVFALLRDKARRTNGEGWLIVDHHGTDDERFEAAIDARNLDMVGTGQPMWGHGCQGCMKFKKNAVTKEIEYVSALVLDGVSVRCRCCSVSCDEDGMPCLEPLMHPKHRFCGKHGQNLWRCFVRDCPNDRGDHSRACSDPQHQALEKEEQAIAGRGTQELHRRAARLGRVVQEASLVDSHCRGAAEEGETPEDECVGPPPGILGGKNAEKKRRKRLVTSKYTHCEMLALAPCGIIRGRTTLFNAEGIKAVVTWLKLLCPVDLWESLPSAIFYDKACHLLEHLLKTKDPYLTARTAHFYDLFHGAFCHKEGDTFCNDHCNPTNFPDVLDDQGRIIFNTSACEQANAWFGGFVTIVREMSLSHFGFFLDEMIMIHNEIAAMRLEDNGFNPTILPEEFWNGGWCTKAT